MSPAPGRSLELYYIDGRPDGMLTAELFNWTGHVLMTPRTQIATALKRPEAGYAGIYLLINEQENEPRAYIGEGEDISARIKTHDTKKDWWTNAVLVTTAGNKLNKAHVRYLEARLIAQAQSIGRVLLENGTKPTLPSLSEADAAKMEAFLENLLIVLPAVRVDMFIQRARSLAVPASPATALPAASMGQAAAPAAVRFWMKVSKYGLQATARLDGGEFIVEAGSRARLRWEGQGDRVSSYASLHGELVRTGILEARGDYRVFTSSYVFQSMSAAAAVVAGRTANGPATWRVEGENIRYSDWEARQLSKPCETA